MKKTKNKKSSSMKHMVPDGFWSQVGSMLLLVLSLIIILSLAGVRGSFTDAIVDGLYYVIGNSVYILPAVLIWIAIKRFTSKEGRIPYSVIINCIILVVMISILFNGFITDGGGILGSYLGNMMAGLISGPGSLLLALAVSAINILFILSISPRELYEKTMFSYQDAKEHKNSTIKLNDIDEKSSPSKIRSVSLKNLFAKKQQSTDGADSESRAASSKKVDGLRVTSAGSQDEEPVKSTVSKSESALTINKNEDSWMTPEPALLDNKQFKPDAGDIKKNAQIIKETLADFKVDVEMEEANIGPRVTQFTLKPPSGVRLQKITALDTNLALNLAAESIRIEAPIPGKKAVGIEVPNKRSAIVTLRGIIESSQWKHDDSKLSFAIGKDISGKSIIGQLDAMPHLLIAGQTGSGKSIMINTFLLSLLYKNSPSDLKLILVDPKRVELSPYNHIPHLLTQVITDPDKCLSALKWAVDEMERRYELLAEKGKREIKSFNDSNAEEKLPYIVIVIDELADLMMVAARDVESLIVRIAQKARAIGIHLVLATQRPSVDVITGLIKANIPARIAFTVASQIDSRTIIDQTGAEKLLGKGDLLFTTPQITKPQRIQGAFVSEDEVNAVVNFVKSQAAPNYDEDVVKQQVNIGSNGGVVMDFDGSSGDEDLYKDSVKVVVDAGKASASLLQRRLRIGYSRASRMIDVLEERGVIGPADGARPREVLISSIDESSDSGNN
jgi:S-DNA-T family DNA segregation ATPase FtsK/SpoIIIE